MGNLVRTGLSLERELLERFDTAINRRGYQNRSEAIRDLIRQHLVEEAVEDNKVIVGTLTMVYDHHQPNLSAKLIEAQHAAASKVLAATHVHLDHHHCLEVVILKGRSGEVKTLADRILSLRGVKHGQLTVTTTGKNLK
ncbi:MAG: nickel-responsive transcriptional regulator NikR [Terriglobia bacterium]|jgi:CopG family nickel-responsive transcriptional regulator